jgi:predicted nucleotidyltransferase
MNEFLNKLINWGLTKDSIDAIILVGSYARVTNTKESDIDVCIITAYKEEMLSDQSFAEYFGEIDRKKTEYYGACTSIRVFYKDGPEVEFGLVEPDWIRKPLDAGTHRVLSDGFKVLVDKKEYFKELSL